MRIQRQPNLGIERQPTASPKRSLSLVTALELWNSDSRAQGFSERYVYTRTSIITNFAWWMEHVAGVGVALDSLNPATVRSFLGYLREPNPTGRFGSNHPNAKKLMRPATLNRYYRDIRTFVNFLQAEGLLNDGSVLQNVKPPKLSKDQVQPLTEQEIGSLLNATHHTVAPERNRAILLLLLDTGLRLSELCSLTMGAVQSNCVEVLGKGNKRRTVFFGKTARRALNTYVSRFRSEAEDNAALFVSAGGVTTGEAMTPTGVYQAVKQVVSIAGIKGKQVSPHVFRHTFCISFLRNGGNLLTLQQLVGHSDLSILKRYVALAENDLAVAHRMASPADHMKLRQ